MPILDKPLREDKNIVSRATSAKIILHAVLFPKNNFSLSQAKEWLKSHNYKYIHNRDTTNIHRFRIKEQIKGYNFFTIKLPNFAELVFMRK